LISEGFDLPRIEAAILLRPTKSTTLYLQQVGRALRPDRERGKTQAIILDHVRNWELHGLPDLDREWDLAGSCKRNRSSDEEEITTHTCKECFRIYQGSKCPNCGTATKSRGEKPRGELTHDKDGKLVKIGAQHNYVALTGDEYRALRNAQTHEEVMRIIEGKSVTKGWLQKFFISQAKSLEDMYRVAILLNYNPRWAEHRYEARHGAEDLAEAKRIYEQQKKTA
jgi:hypothetical protein